MGRGSKAREHWKALVGKLITHFPNAHVWMGATHVRRALFDVYVPYT